MLVARDIMTDDIVSIRPTATVEEAIEQLLMQRISGLAVVDERERLVGIVTEFALLAIAYDPSIVRDSVSLHMTTDLLTVDVNDPVRKVADLCIVHRVRRVPVMDNGRFVGLIARRDVLRALHQSESRVAAGSAATSS